MNRPNDPYERLATLMWLLRPVDVERLVEVADRLADARIAALSGDATQLPTLLLLGSRGAVGLRPTAVLGFCGYCFINLGL